MHTRESSLLKVYIKFSNIRDQELMHIDVNITFLNAFKLYIAANQPN